MKHLFLSICIAAMPCVVSALDYSDMTTKTCIASQTDHMSKLSCIGRSADQCMIDSEGGYSTVGMGGCLDLELQFWDAQLNAAYKDLTTKLKAADAEMEAIGSAAPKQWPALQAMQRAWIPFRDATCDLERSFWGGGTGGGPATLSCLMTVTAEQTLKLQQLLDRAN